MVETLIPLTFEKIMQTRSYTVVILAGQEKRFAIYTDPNIGKTLQLLLTDAEKQRPLTHDLIGMIFTGLNIRVKQVVINDVQDTVYFARLYLEQEQDDILHIVEIDARPSDCITLALMSQAPVFCTQEMLSKAISVYE